MIEWQLLGTVPVERLKEARLQLHWAAQVAAAVGKLLLPRQPDYSEQSFVWSETAAALVQGAVAAAMPFRAALRPSPPSLLLLGHDDAPLAALPLGGRTLGELYDALAAEVEALLGGSLPMPLERPGELPDHPVGMGERFDTRDDEAFAEVGRLFGNGHRLLTAAASRFPGASPVRCWPHHLDIATLIQLDPPGGDAETARTIGAGLTPGDSERPAPYLYVTPWPYPKEAELPPLPEGGQWNGSGWMGAVFEAPELLRGPSALEQEARAERFVSAAIDACRRLVGA